MISIKKLLKENYRTKAENMRILKKFLNSTNAKVKKLAKSILSDKEIFDANGKVDESNLDEAVEMFLDSISGDSNRY